MLASNIGDADAVARVDVCGVPFTSSCKTAVLDSIARNISNARSNRVIAITNTESMFFALRRPEHLEFVRSATFSLCDGVGAVIAAGAHGLRLRRFNGPVLMEECCAYGLQYGWRHFFYGGRPGVAELLSAKLSQRFPGLIVAGTYSPPFRSTPVLEDAEVLEGIQQAHADILWVGLGLLKQEQWIAKHITHLRVPWFIGVGAAFDFHAGTARWAPRWIQRVGFEWLYRLCHEPRMLARNGRSFIVLGQAVVEVPFRRLSRRTPSGCG